MNRSCARWSWMATVAVALTLAAAPAFGSGLAERVERQWQLEVEARREAQTEDADTVRLVGHLFNFVDYRSTGGMESESIEFTDRWYLYQDRLERVALDVSAVRSRAEALHAGGVAVTGRMVGDRFLVSRISADSRGDTIDVPGRIIYEGSAVGPGGETESTIQLIADTADGKRQISLETLPRDLVGRRVVASGQPYWTRPTATMGIQEILFRLESIEPAEPTPGELMAQLRSVLLLRNGADYSLVDLESGTFFPVEVGLVEQEARRLASYGALFATVALEREANGSITHHLSAVGPQEVDGGLQSSYLNGSLPVTILSLAGDPNADGYVTADVLLMDGTTLRLPLPADTATDLEGHPVRIDAEWYMGGSARNGVPVLGGVAYARSLWPDMPIEMQPWRTTVRGWIVPVEEDRFGFVLRTGEAIEIDLSALADEMGGIEAVSSYFKSIIRFGGYAEVFGQFPAEDRDDTEGLWAFEVSSVPGVGDLRLQGRVVETDESESGLGLSIGRGIDRVTVPLRGVNAAERSALRVGSWATVSGEPFIHRPEGWGYIIGLEVEAVR